MREAIAPDLMNPADELGRSVRVVMMIPPKSRYFSKLFCLLIVALAWPAIAEEIDTAEVDKLRTAYIDEPKRKVIEAWIGKQIKVLVDEEAEPADKRRIRQVFYEVATKKPDPSENFKRKFVESTVRLFDPHLKKDEVTGPLAMVYIMHDIRGLQPDVMLRGPGLLTALTHPYPAVRYWAAKTIHLLHAAFSNSAGLRGPIIQALRQAGIEENNGVAMREIYTALDFSKTVGKVPFSDAVAKALIDIIDARAKKYARGDVATSDAEAAGLSAMTRQAGPMKDKSQADLRKRYLTALARILCRAVDDYSAELAITAELEKKEEKEKVGLTRDRRSRIRQQLQVCRHVEEELTRLVKAAGITKADLPNVLAAMRNGDPDSIADERDAWCGWPPETKGILNDKVLGVALGGGYAELDKKGETAGPAETQPEKSPADAKPANR